MPSSNDIRAKVMEAITDAYREFGHRVFVPEQFVVERIGDEAAVLDALRWLAEDQCYLKVRAWVKCADGHDIWQGPPHEAPKYARAMCPRWDCETHRLSEDEFEDEENQPYVELRFQISPVWLQLLDEQQKKTPQSHPAY